MTQQKVFFNTTGHTVGHLQLGGVIPTDTHTQFDTTMSPAVFRPRQHRQLHPHT